MTIKHRLVNATVIALGTFERFGAEMVAQMILQVVFVLGDEIAFGTGEHLLRLDMLFGVFPEVLLIGGHEWALFALIFAILTTAAIHCRLSTAHVHTLVALILGILFDYSTAGPTLGRNF